MRENKRLWITVGLFIFGAFFVLGWFGREVYRNAPPIPERVQTASGETLVTREDILQGQQVWQSIGGQQVGSVWGHGAYQAPDWSADWLHREAIALRDIVSLKRYGNPFGNLSAPEAAAVGEEVKAIMRKNTYDPTSGTLTVSEERAQAIARTAEHYLALFGSDLDLGELRDAYALKESAVSDPLRRQALTAFFFWTSWAATTQRPNTGATYTNNWPHEPLVGNTPTSANLIWSLVSIALLIAGIGALVAYKLWLIMRFGLFMEIPARNLMSDEGGVGDFRSFG